jgi:polygalacturonase
MVWSKDATHELDLEVHQIVDFDSEDLDASSFWGIVPVSRGGVLELWFSDTRNWYRPIASAVPPASIDPETVLTGVNPQTGDKAGGYTLNVYGTNIKANSVVRIGGTTATIVSSNSSVITVTVPAHSIGLNTITVTDPQGTTKTLTNIFTYTEVVLPLPVISVISSGTPDTTEATITFTTDVDCSSYIQWGLTTTYDNSNFPGHDTVDQTSHSHTLTGLTPAVTYHYKITVMDINNNVVSSADGTFLTATPATFPVISAIDSGTPVYTGTTITWTTDIAATSQVDYGPTNAYGYSTTLDPALVTSHSVIVDGLTAGTTYHYRVRSVSAASAETVSADGTFTTATALTTTLNSIWDNTAPPAGEGTGNQTVGTKFKATVDGNIIGARYYKYATDSVIRDVRLWDNAGTLLASRTVSGQTASGWQRMDFATPVAITAETTYVVGYHPTNTAEVTRRPTSNNLFATLGVTNDKLYAYATTEITPGNGVVGAPGGVFPTTATDDSYYADVVFEYTTGGVEPTGLAITNINASNVTQASATINWALSGPGTGYVEWGTVSGVYPNTNYPGQNDLTYSAHSQNISGLTAETTYYYRVRSTDAALVETVSAVNTFTTLAVVAGGGGSFHAPAPTNSLIVNVKNTGAVGNGVADDTAEIQAAVNQVGGTGGTVLVPAGTYMIDALTSVNLKSNMTFKMETGAVLKAIPNSAYGYSILKAQNASNLNVVGGTIKGERNEHLTPGNYASETPSSAQCPNPSGDCWGQWGYGISIWGGSNIYIENVISRDCWGDGFYVSSNASNVNFYSIVADNNRRQGISIVWANGVVIRDSVIKNTRGHNPQTGIDLEPNANNSVNNVQILNNTFDNNEHGAVASFGKAGPVSNVIVTGNTTTGGNMGMRFSYSTTNVTVTNNTINNPSGWAFFTYGGLTGSTIINNTVRAPVLFYGPFTGNIITPNDFTVI